MSEWTLTVRGIGPHTGTSIRWSAKGVTTISGRSQAGKSTLLDALCFVLWGQDRTGRPFPAEAIHGDMDRASATLTLPNGAIFDRELLVEGGKRTTTRRHVTSAGVEHLPSTEKAWAELLGPLGKRAELARIIAVGGWEELAASAGDGRRFRDLLLFEAAGLDEDKETRAIVVARLAEHGITLEPQSVMDERSAMQACKAQRSAVDKAEGALGAIRAQMDSAADADDGGPDTISVGEARHTLLRGEAWRKYRDAKAAYDAAREADGRHKAELISWRAKRDSAEDRHKAALAAWEEKRRALGDEPADVSGQLTEARAALDAAVLVRDGLAADLAGLQTAARKAESDLAEVRKVLAQEARDCPTCGKPGWDEAGERRAELELHAKVLGDALAELRRDRDDAEDRLKSARRKASEAKQAAGLLEATRDARAAWLERAHELGAAPRPEYVGVAPVAPEIPPEPTRPHGVEVTRADIVKAEETIRLAERAIGAADRAAQERERLTAQMHEAAKALDAAKRRLATLEAMLYAVRRAPAELLGRFGGDLGPVTLEPTAKGGVRVLVDGLPWDCVTAVSRGRRVVADAWIRSALRRVSKLMWLPIFLDDANAVGGQELPMVAPCVALRTTDDEGLTVRMESDE
jgi:hypothetical protein